MKAFPRLALISAAGAALVLAGCTKKPVRPYPSETLMGPQGAGNGAGSLNPQSVPTSAELNGLEPRGAGDFDANGQLRGVLQPVFFDFDRSTIKPSERAKLQAAQQYLNQNATVGLLIEGHCDWRGTPEYNLALGDRRASEAKKYLIGLGVSADRIETLSKGSEDAVKNADQTTMAHDRRDDLVILKQPPGGGAPAAGPGAGPAAGGDAGMGAPDAASP